MRQIKEFGSKTQENVNWQANLTGQDHFLFGERPPFWWTGCPPEINICPGVDAEGKIHSLPILNLDQANRQKLLEYYNNTWTLTDVLFSALQGEQAFYRPPYHGLRHPLLFYYGHSSVFYINKLRLAGLIAEPLNLEYEQLFEMGVDEMSWDDMSKNDMIWPGIMDVIQYRRSVYSLVKNLILNHPIFESPKITITDPRWSLIMSMEHERIHLETSSVLIRELPIELVKKPNAWPLGFNSQNNFDKRGQLNAHSNNLNMIYLPKQTVQIGKSTDNPYYGWDNEYGNKITDVHPFYASQDLITNENFLEFVNDNGYLQNQYWKEAEAWQWREFRQAKAPTFWVNDSREKSGYPPFKLRQCFEIIDMPWKSPVIVNFYEAKAYCTWLSEKMGEPYRLLTEAEHYCLRGNSAPLIQPTKDKPANLNLNYGSEIPIGLMSANALGFHDVFGNVWQWVEDPFHPLPGFEAHPYYLDFSTPCFDGKHQMILGGSFISSGDETSYFARFHFRPHFYQHAGFRIVRGSKQIISNE